MSKVKLKKPLDAKAVKSADDQFYAQHPEMVKNGQRIPLDPNDPTQASLIKEWRDNYVANGGQLEDTDFGSDKPGQVVSPCKPSAALQVKVTDCASGDPLADVNVEISGPQSAKMNTDSTGVANFGTVPPGEYYIWAQKAGRQKNTCYANVTEGPPTVASFCLSPSGEDYWVEFKYLMQGTQYPVSDSEPWTLVYPGGAKEQGNLQNGDVRRDGVPQGVYELRPQHLTGVSWDPSSAHGGEEVQVTVNAENVPDGAGPVDIKIFRQFESPDNTPIDTLSASFSGNKAQTQWKYVQQKGQPPFGKFVAIATWGSKSALSDPLVLTAYPVDDDRGLQQRLKHLGYDPGEIDGIVGPNTEGAARQFQQDHPPLEVDGIPGPHTRGMLGDITY